MYQNNLKRAEALISQAKSAGAELVLLPEFFNSAMGFDRRMLCVARQSVSTHEWMVKLAAQYGIILGGAYISQGASTASITWNTEKRRSTSAIPDAYWIPELPTSYIDAWNRNNSAGKQYNEKIKKPLYATVSWQCSKHKCLKRNRPKSDNQKRKAVL